MINVKAGTSAILVGLFFLVGFQNSAEAQPFSAAIPTITLDASGDSSIGYHPGFDQYYASGIGSTGQPGYVFDNMGNLIHTEQPLNIDVRAINFNPNTGLMEVVTYDALAGGSGRGLIEAQLDANGLFNGGTSTLLAAMPGNLGSQTMPAYDAARNRFYSRFTGNQVSIVSRTTGSSLGTITLDFTTAGVISATYAALAYAPSRDWLIITDNGNDTAVVFDLNGAYLGTSTLNSNVPTYYGIGYANNQLFVLDSELGVYHGYDISGDWAPPSAAEIAPVPAMTTIGLLLLIASILLLSFAAVRSRSTG